MEVRGQSWVSVLTSHLFEMRSLGCLLLSLPGQQAQGPQGILLSLFPTPHRSTGVIDRPCTGIHHGCQGTERIKSLVWQVLCPLSVSPATCNTLFLSVGAIPGEASAPGESEQLCPTVPSCAQLGAGIRTHRAQDFGGWAGEKGKLWLDTLRLPLTSSLDTRTSPLPRPSQRKDGSYPLVA